MANNNEKKPLFGEILIPGLVVVFGEQNQAEEKDESESESEDEDDVENEVEYSSSSSDSEPEEKIEQVIRHQPIPPRFPPLKYPAQPPAKMDLWALIGKLHTYIRTCGYANMAPSKIWTAAEHASFVKQVEQVMQALDMHLTREGYWKTRQDVDSMRLCAQVVCTGKEEYEMAFAGGTDFLALDPTVDYTSLLRGWH